MVNESHYARMPLFKAWRLPASAPLCACLGLFHYLLGGAHSLAECDSFSTLHVQMPFSLCENVLCILIWVIASSISFLKSVEFYLSKESGIFCRDHFGFHECFSFQQLSNSWFVTTKSSCISTKSTEILVWRIESNWETRFSSACHFIMLGQSALQQEKRVYLKAET